MAGCDEHSREARALDRIAELRIHTPGVVGHNAR
jgi:hypothetical protein